MGTAQNFFKQVLALPIVLCFWVCGYFWKRTGWVNVEKIDLDTGLREHDWDEIEAHRAIVASWPRWRRFLNKIM